ncbi:MAG: hypothetical protein HQ546_04515, partial [Planctomycetes bacterium]|nr:hypothetical protein [Planctomycetota bacterium]
MKKKMLICSAGVCVLLACALAETIGDNPSAGSQWTNSLDRLDASATALNAAGFPRHAKELNTLVQELRESASDQPTVTSEQLKSLDKLQRQLTSLATMYASIKQEANKVTAATEQTKVIGEVYG